MKSCDTCGLSFEPRLSPLHHDSAAECIAALRKQLAVAQSVVDAAQKWGEAVVKLDDIDGGEDMDSYLTATDTLLNQLAAYNRVTSEAKQLTDA